MIPCCCLMEFMLTGKLVSNKELTAIVLVIAGVYIATVSDVSPSLHGSAAAFTGVLSSSAHNVACGALCRKYKIDAAALVRDTAPLQTAALLLLGPLVDHVLVDTFPWEWSHRREVFGKCYNLILMSCALAAVVNISLVSCIKTYSATGAFPKQLARTRPTVFGCKY